MVNPATTSRAKKILLILLIVFLAGSSCFLGFLFYQNSLKLKKLDAENNQLEVESCSPFPSSCPDLDYWQKQIADLQKQVDDLKEQNNNLVRDKSDLQGKINKANTYLDFLNYLMGVAINHGGLEGWTEEEYQIGRQKAQATNDDYFLFIVDEAWKNDQYEQLPRLLAVFGALTQGLNNALK